MDKLQSYSIPPGWRVYLPADFVPDPEAEPPFWRFIRVEGDFSVYFTAWTFSDGDLPADPDRLLELFGEAAQSSALQAADLSAYAPEGLSLTAWQGRTVEGVRMTIAALAAPGRMLASYLVGSSLVRREALMNCLRKAAWEGTT